MQPKPETRSQTQASIAATTPAASSRDATRASLQGQGFEAQSAALRPSVQLKKTTVMQDIALAQDPNDREKAILENDADAASAWVQAASWAIGIASTYSHTRPDSGKSMYGGRADALRHFLWNAYMAFMLGEERAAALANAHELAEAPSDGNTAVDRQMDLRNNAAGRRLGVFHRGQGAITRAFALSLMAAAGISFVNDGSLTIIDKRDDNNWKLVPSNTPGID